jgi:hypothetical protein
LIDFYLLSFGLFRCSKSSENITKNVLFNADFFYESNDAKFGTYECVYKGYGIFEVNRFKAFSRKNWKYAKTAETVLQRLPFDVEFLYKSNGIKMRTIRHVYKENENFEINPFISFKKRNKMYKKMRTRNKMKGNKFQVVVSLSGIKIKVLTSCVTSKKRHLFNVRRLNIDFEN